MKVEKLDVTWKLCHCKTLSHLEDFFVLIFVERRLLGGEWGGGGRRYWVRCVGGDSVYVVLYTCR